MNAAIRRLLEGRILSTAELAALTGIPIITLQNRPGAVKLIMSENGARISLNGMALVTKFSSTTALKVTKALTIKKRV